ncbi:hypothetical protein ZIOFF_012107 [Zingiber officinale]|uniref:Uncharacterized protein n=1 Tax=Zingiber officinale TaxID=94328 RepID=A0A8J5M077_ZINOF|nr:hypothetical protein ZIOFF_012107 [Zingiber officinale]
MNSTDPPPDPETFARSYQLEVLEKAKKDSTIIFLETGSEKTLIVVMLLRSYAFAIRKPSRHIVVFLVPTIILVTQVAKPRPLQAASIPGLLGMFQNARVESCSVSEMANECCSIQLIDGDGVFNVTSLEHFMKSVKLAEHGLSYAVVSIMGPQSSDDTAFEKQSALFALAVSDIILINILRLRDWRRRVRFCSDQILDFSLLPIEVSDWSKVSICDSEANSA